MKKYNMKEKVILAKACLAEVLFILSHEKPPQQIITEIEEHIDEFLNYPTPEQATLIVALGKKVR